MTASTEKSADAFRTISEVAQDLALPQHVLRFWETRFPHIKPLKRGGGRRYYRPDDVELLKGIRHLLYADGYTIKGVQRLLKEHGAKAVAAASKGARFDRSGAPADAEDKTEDDPPDSRGEFRSAEDAMAGDEMVLPGVETPLVFGVPGLSAADRQRLECALVEIAECERVLAAAREG